MAQRLYCIAESASGPVKIGISANIARRLPALQTGNPRPLHVYASMKLSNAREVEQMAHKFLADRQLVGEWFNVPVADAMGAVDLIVQGRKPSVWARLWRWIRGLA